MYQRNSVCGNRKWLDCGPPKTTDHNFPPKILLLHSPYVLFLETINAIRSVLKKCLILNYFSTSTELITLTDQNRKFCLRGVITVNPGSLKSLNNSLTCVVSWSFTLFPDCSNHGCSLFIGFVYYQTVVCQHFYVQPLKDGFC